jgi:hypothetical protein
MNLMRIRLVLARTPEFPVGSSEHGYEFIGPLTSDEHIDAEAWKKVKEKCRVVRFWGDEPERQGFLRHVGHGWRFDYDPKDDADDEPFFKLDRHDLRPGAYVSVTESDGVQRPFRVESVLPVVTRVRGAFIPPSVSAF